MFCSNFLKSGVPRPVTYDAQTQPTSNMKRFQSSGTNGIPPGDGRESLSLAALVRARCDVSEAREQVAVQPGIEETKRGLAVRNKIVIKQRDDARHCLDISSWQSARRLMMDDGERREKRVGKDTRAWSSSCRPRQGNCSCG